MYFMYCLCVINGWMDGWMDWRALMTLHLRATGCHLPYGITVLPAIRHKWTHFALTTASDGSFVYASVWTTTFQLMISHSCQRRTMTYFSFISAAVRLTKRNQINNRPVSLGPLNNIELLGISDCRYHSCFSRVILKESYTELPRSTSFNDLVIWLVTFEICDQ